MSQARAIGEPQLLKAAHGHMERVESMSYGDGGDGVAELLVSMDVSPDEVASVFKEIKRLHVEGGMDEDQSGSYFGGVLDGFIIGVRAARDAEGVLDG